MGFNLSLEPPQPPATPTNLVVRRLRLAAQILLACLIGAVIGDNFLAGGHYTGPLIAHAGTALEQTQEIVVGAIKGK
jgi:hypothetical protein